MSLLRALTVILVLVTTVGRSMAQTQRSSIRVTPLVSGVDASFRGMAVRGRREAWVAGSGGVVIRTSDAGRTWEPITVPGAGESDFRDVELLPDGTALLMSVGKGNASRVLRSVDRGTTWRTVLVNSEPEGFFDGMAFRADGLNGVLYGDPIDGRMDIYRTSDGGETWSRLPVQARPKLKEGEYGFAASGTGVVAKGQDVWIATGGSVARVWHSSDQGTTWQPHATPIRSGNESSGIFSIDVIDQRKAVVIGGDYREPERDRDNVATSLDGGKTWSVVPGASMPHKACVQSLGNDRVITCGRTGVAFSEDAGKTWTTVSSDSYYTLRVDRTSGTGFLAGKDGRVARLTLSLAE